jgi:hypothetical protein
MTRFPEIARQEFAFLEDTGFRLISSGDSGLEYESAQAFVLVRWDRRSGELGVWVGCRSTKCQKRDAYSLTDLLRMVGVETSENKLPFQAAKEGRLDLFLQKLSQYTRLHAQPALAGDRMFFRRLGAFRDAQARTLMNHMNLRQVRSEAEQAWQSRKLDRVVGLYASIEGRLTPSEKRRLDYARKHVSP